MPSSASLVTNDETIATGLGRLGSELDAEAQLVQTQIPAAGAADAADDAGPPGEPRAELDFNELPPTTVSTVITGAEGSSFAAGHVTWRGLTSTNPPVSNSS